MGFLRFSYMETNEVRAGSTALDRPIAIRVWLHKSIGSGGIDESVLESKYHRPLDALIRVRNTH